MKKITRRSMALLMALVLCLSMASGLAPQAEAAAKKPTVANWGIRGQVATSLSDYAEAFYTGSYTFDNLITHEGTHLQNQIPQSDLYKTLQSFMASRHTYQTNYDELRYDVYNYTDCEGGNTGSISCFYSAKAIGPKWDSGNTWNREHTWPQSKGSNKSTPAGSDIMAVRPTAKSANGSRGNKAYGESADFYHPNTGTNYDLRGDCARIVLYTYVRWGTPEHIKNMFGKSGVIENQHVLLKWMQEDPVDTWELGRNDSIQSYTGTRNVFVDYPELAFLLFGQQVPEDMVTPSGEAAGGVEPEPPVTEPPVTEPPVTEPPVTEPPVTQPPVTEPPVTQPPVTQPPVTEPEQTEPPVTEPEQTEPPVTEPEQTEPPATQPEQTQPPATEPEASEPDTTEPSATEPNYTEPGTVQPVPSQPDAAQEEDAPLGVGPIVCIVAAVLAAVVAVFVALKYKKK